MTFFERALCRRITYDEWTVAGLNLMLGLWLMMSAWVVGYDQDRAFWVLIATGALVGLSAGLRFGTPPKGRHSTSPIWPSPRGWSSLPARKHRLNRTDHRTALWLPDQSQAHQDEWKTDEVTMHIRRREHRSFLPRPRNVPPRRPRVFR
jgi:hypothetical protein